MDKLTAFLTHLERETIRFFTVPNNTLVPGLVSAFLYLVIFGVGLGRRISVPGYDYLEFLIPGLVMLNLINGSYSNPSGSLFMSRFMEHIRDLLSSPMSHLSMTWAYVIGGISRGFTMGLGVWLIAMPFEVVSIKHPWVLLFYLILTSILFASFGIFVGLWAEEFEQLNIFLNFVITPLAFLGGVFYSVSQVPETLQYFTKFNPLFYMINGVRYGMIGWSEASLWLGAGILIPLTAAMWGLSFYLIKTGWHLRD